LGIGPSYTLSVIWKLRDDPTKLSRLVPARSPGAAAAPHRLRWFSSA
jgi:hypothetical protein